MGERLGFSWRLFWILFLAAIFGIAASVPAGLDLFGSVLARSELPPVPLPLLVALGVIQNLALVCLFVGVGLKLSRKLGLGARLTEAWLNDESVLDQLRKVVASGAVAGILVGGVLLPVVLILAPHLPKLPFVSAARISIWKRILVCFYGGLFEEILSRLFLLSLFAWLFNRSWRKEPGQLSSRAFWFANFIVAILFGLGHLPSASLVMQITPLVVVAALLLNGFAALVFGWLYRQWGLEAAMIAHFIADFLLYVVGPEFV
jgi:membrane protease YdiL (CAAX protease family)